MTTVRDIYNALFAFAPASMKMDWDNVGLLCGRFDAPVDTVLVALDPMPDVIDEAKKVESPTKAKHFMPGVTAPMPCAMSMPAPMQRQVSTMSSGMALPSV